MNTDKSKHTRRHLGGVERMHISPEDKAGRQLTLGSRGETVLNMIEPSKKPAHNIPYPAKNRFWPILRVACRSMSFWKGFGPSCQLPNVGGLGFVLVTKLFCAFHLQAFKASTIIKN